MVVTGIQESRRRGGYAAPQSVYSGR